MQVKVAIDCMGGDHGAHVTVPAALEVARGDSDVSIILVGLRDSIERELERHGATVGGRISVHHASQVVEMDEAPAAAMRAKKAETDVAFCERLLEATGVALVPGTAFGAPGHLRLSFAASTATLTEALRRIHDFLST